MLIRRTPFVIVLIFALISIAFFSGCWADPYINDEQADELSSSWEDDVGVNIPPGKDIDETPLSDYLEAYSQHGYDVNDIIYFYVTVSRGAEGTHTDHSLAEVEAFEKTDGDYYATAVYSEAIVQEGDENGPYLGAFGYNAVLPNATINVRGSSTTRVNSEKSFSLKLKDSAGRWRDQSFIALVKSPFDPTRIRNKLSFDLVRDIPDILSYRTQFVRLFIRDATSGSDEFVDYGFYTQVEVPNKRYLKNHALDNNGQLYKAIMFEFYQYEDVLRTKDDPLYSEVEFSAVLRIKGNDDHSKLINMLRDVNDYGLDINTVMERHFNLDNYLTWLALNILTGNIDTTSQNFMLYSPQNGNIWYFMLWDHDGAWATGYDISHGLMEKRLGKYAVGLTNYWGVVLHQRFLIVPENRALLEAKMDELQERYLTPEKISSQIQAYLPLATDHYMLMPDLYHLNFSIEEHLQSLENTAFEIELNKRLYYESLNWPMPFFIWEPVPVEGGALALEWGSSYSLREENIYYDVTISKYIDKSNPVFEQKGLRETHVSFSTPEPGLYYYWVEARTESGQTMPAFDSFQEDGLVIWGARRFFIDQNGGIVYDFDFYKNQ